ncbi:hypothetical protein D3C87_1471880 [compost metagenome]
MGVPALIDQKHSQVLRQIGLSRGIADIRNFIGTVQTDHQRPLFKKARVNPYIQVFTCHDVLCNLIELDLTDVGFIRILKDRTCPAEHRFRKLLTFPTNGRSIFVFPTNGQKFTCLELRPLKTAGSSRVLQRPVIDGTQMIVKIIIVRATRAT